MALLGAVAVIIFIFKKGEITIYDWLVLFIFTIPFHTLRIGGVTHFIRLSEIAFLPFFLWWVIERFLRPKGPLKMRKEFIMMLGFLAINILSTIKSMSPLVSIKRVIIIAYLILFCYLVSDIIRSPKRLLFVIKAMIVISALSAILAILQSFMPQFHIFTTLPLVSLGKISFYRAGAGWHDPNYYAMYLAMNIVLTLSLLFAGVLNKRSLLITCLILQLGGMVATFSRMGHIALFAAFLYLLSIYGKRRSAITIFLIIILLLSGLVYSIDYIYQKAPFIQAYIFRVPDIGLLKKHPSMILVHRWDAFRANWRMFLDNPFLGVGPFMSMRNYARYRPFDAIWQERESLATHNQYLELLSEKGIFGFLFFMGFILLVFRKLTHYIKERRGVWQDATLVGLKAAIIVYLISCLVGQATHELQFWLTMGLSLVLFNILEKGYEDAK
jgi:O-antigen ligase